jgi:hypothetical protein
MGDLDGIMQVMAMVALLLYLAPAVIGGRVGAQLPRIAAAVLTVAFILALVQTFFWFAK